MYPEDLKYSKEHEWMRQEGNVGVIGITHFAQDQLGDVVFVEVPAVGDKVTAGATFGVVESVKTVSDLYSPVTGTVVAVNDRLTDEPELVNNDPYGDGWMIKVEIEATGEMMDAAAYQEHIKNG